MLITSRIVIIISQLKDTNMQCKVVRANIYRHTQVLVTCIPMKLGMGKIDCCSMPMRMKHDS